jgi:peptide/nickel transport system ATP-binding protein/oligopeptide transport system ATP-binding protein
MSVLLSVRDLSLALRNDGQVLVEDVSFDVPERGVLGIVGESGCGKSVTALSILRLGEPVIGPVAGSILFSGEDLLTTSPRRMQQVRGGEISMIFQEPMTSLNPVLTAGYQIGEALRVHQQLGRRAARSASIELLSIVGIPLPDALVDLYPHQMSGGMCQRVMIALALACRPKLLIADEPTTALDVTVQAQIIDLLRRLQDQFGMAVIIITHDLALVSDFAETIVVMYAGRVVEQGRAAALFAQPLHPYTEKLLDSIPPVDHDVDRLATIPGTVPPPWAMPQGCRFMARCGFATDHCRDVDPKLRTLGNGRLAACHYPRFAHDHAAVG